MGIYVGSQKMSKFNIGSTAISKIYVGSQLVFSGSSQPSNPVELTEFYLVNEMVNYNDSKTVMEDFEIYGKNII